MKVVLCHPSRIEAEGLGMGDLRGDEPVALGSGGVVEQAAEEAEAKAPWRRGNAGHPDQAKLSKSLRVLPVARPDGNPVFAFAYSLCEHTPHGLNASPDPISRPHFQDRKNAKSHPGFPRPSSALLRHSRTR
ncbi:hypothetical protein [Variovorax boronicumulans]|uniref:hypothetical protein n=1 Tax=Variovorax boronicumulans TaxID=436515 RepID=UPI0027D79EFC|nr:hypothetical protein [Variovorax boronicumulans]